jgi:hypothetical protein
MTLKCKACHWEPPSTRVMFGIEVPADPDYRELLLRQHYIEEIQGETRDHCPHMIAAMGAGMAQQLGLIEP